MNEEDEKNKPTPEEEAPESPEVQPEEPETPEDQPEAPEEEPEVAPEEEEPEEPVSRRKAERLEKLLQKMGATDQQIESAKKDQRQQPGKSPERIIEEGDYSLDDINKRASEYGDRRYNEGLSQAETLRSSIMFDTQLALEKPKVYQDYPFMNERAPEFDPGRAVFINRMYLQTVGFDQKTGSVRDNSLTYSEFVDGFMDAVDTQAKVEMADSQGRIVKQAVQTGPRPGGTVKKPYAGEDPKKMTDDQLDAIISQQLGK